MENPGNLHVSKARLEGEVSLAGAKNSALRLLAATLLTEGRVHLTGYPAKLLDAQIHVDMLRALGKTAVLHDDTSITITEESAPKSQLVWEGRSIRNTLLILGALTARTGSGRVPLPGGCKLGERKYDLHVDLLEKLGAPGLGRRRRSMCRGARRRAGGGGHPPCHALHRGHGKRDSLRCAGQGRHPRLEPAYPP